jgi:hypothetical protein
MRVFVRAAICAAAVSVAAAMAPLVPAQADPAPPAGWEYVNFPSVQIDESFFMHKHLKGHPGNWHQLSVRVQQDDDGVVGGLADYRCPQGEAPAPDRHDNCTQVGGYDFVDELGLTVKWSPRLHDVRVFGDLVLEDYFHNNERTQSTMNLRLHASGHRTRTVTLGEPTDTDPTEYKTIDIQRGGKITAHGHLAWLKATPTKVTTTEPLHVYWILSRPVPVG